jgi:hypothetical protein
LSTLLELSWSNQQSLTTSHVSREVHWLQWRV